MRKTSAKKPPTHATSESETTPRLGEYQQKRDPARTNEPFSPERKDSAASTRRGRFVVHLHAATRTHYDLRLQVGHALKSFAVPRGPSLSPDDKRLAVNTEDHPLEYLDFEDVIPEGNYGAGAMIVWDTGRVQYLEDGAEAGIENGKIDFVLSGFKLNGRFALVHTGKRKAERGQGGSSEWLLFKKTDAHASRERDIVAESPRSVLSGLSVEELPERERIGERFEQRAAKLGSAEELDPRKLTPMLCALEGAELDEADRFYELKLDGVRIVAEKSGTQVALRYRHGRAATASYPEVARAVASLAPERLVLDGEIVTFDEAGRPNFQRLAPRIHAKRPLDVLQAANQVPVVYVVFDLLQVGPWSLLKAPLRERKRLLMDLLPGKGLVRALDHLEGDGRPLYDLCRARRLEGVVAKRADSVYRPGPRRTDDWVKIKCEREDEFVVIGWLPGKGGRGSLGALCVASYDGERLRFRGRVGSGMDATTLVNLFERLRDLKVADYPAEGDPPDDLKGAHFVSPVLVVRVRYSGWTEEGRLRAPVFLGERTDIDPQACTAAPPLMEDLDTDEPDARAPRAVAPVTRVQISNRDKVFWPDDGYTKGDLCDYYAAVADVMVPFLQGRPVVLVRYPDGIEGKSFYQWNAPAGTPAWLRTLELRDEKEQEEKGGGKATFLIDDQDGLVHLANLGSIPLHVLASREHSMQSCDFLTIDFDIGDQPFRDAVILALSLRELLSELGLLGFPKTSGQKGLHVLIPLGPGVSFDSAKLMVELIGRLLVSRHADLATMERRVSQRGAKVYVDTGQTGASRTIVAPYSVRAVPGATVSTPLRWEEVHLALDPSRFTLLTVPERINEVGDPMSELLNVKPDVALALKNLERYLARG